ncbi:DUF4355 domain-containing protein [Bacillus atrophaeus]|uniref:DUF4355 domain-containing protein n=1 Tax=Bacillus atrophaeus TaxID=1452 RepID=UPI0022813E4A|nr:DUF4355 domain-containing protein [Bacillus atrophaeus]MCY8813669.1 DUF4355 domain-containing protein [Bacillus atrophaeus]MCY8820258.1 DUF4355 domain-containing protein [Bacillus atrophaeus]MCY8828618.1 DUF4355 domain-containing protein [Bacillus atrophaeus]MCY8832705.1 DUF4355 domain-containing protein [Bacillus atrophaeus]MEC0749761.1 DUF4355 domain-containing protein [Bacillus atrophaeus]
MKRLNTKKSVSSSMDFFRKDRLPLRINLQHFADGGEGGNTAEPTPGNQSGGPGNGPVPSQPGVGELTLDAVRTFLESNDEGKKLLQSTSDARVTEAIKTYEKNTLPKKLEEEISKRFPPETEEQKQLRELQEKFQNLEHEKTRAALRSTALSIASEQSLPTKLVDFFIGQDEDSTAQNLNVLSEALKTYRQSIIDEKFKQGGSTPPPSGGAAPITKEAIKNMSEAEINQNWDQIQEVLKGQ